MEFGTKLPLQADPGYLGDPILVGGPPRSHLVHPRSHLVAPQPAPADLREDLIALRAYVYALETRVAALEAPGWWRRSWIWLVTHAQILWTRVRKE